jgi:multisubunit Na+/H+ antiporter MnhB subunit
MDFDTLSYTAEFAATGLVALVIGVLAGLRDRRERRRRDLDRISTVPWGLLSALFSLFAIILLATAAKTWFAG